MEDWWIGVPPFVFLLPYLFYCVLFGSVMAGDGLVVANDLHVVVAGAGVAAALATFNVCVSAPPSRSMMLFCKGKRG